MRSFAKVAGGAGGGAASLFEGVYYRPGGKTEQYLAIARVGRTEGEEQFEEVLKAAYEFHVALVAAGEVQSETPFIFTVLFSCGTAFGRAGKAGRGAVAPEEVDEALREVQSRDRGQAREYQGGRRTGAALGPLFSENKKGPRG
jgi:hypothetical protein